MLGISDASPLVATALLTLLAGGAVVSAYLLLRSGWRLRG
jgi:hypothetical protein